MTVTINLINVVVTETMYVDTVFALFDVYLPNILTTHWKDTGRVR